MSKPSARHIVMAFAVIASSSLIGFSVLAIRNQPVEIAGSSIAAALVVSNSRYQFTDGVWRRGWSTIHVLEPATALRVEGALRRAANRTGVPVNYLAAYVRRESTGDSRAEYRNVAQWDAAKDDRGRFAATDHGLVQISGQNLIAMFPGSTLEESKAKAEDIDFATSFLADHVAGDLKWAAGQDIDTREGIHQGLLTRAKNPYWLATLAYNRGREGALAALSNPRACRHAELVIQDWAQIDAITGFDSATAIHAPTFPALPKDDPLRLAMGDIRSDVEALQRLLNDRLALNPPLVTDGNFGPATRDALIRFQRSHNLEPSGATDAPTWAALMGTVAAKSSGDSKPLVMGNKSPRVESLQRLLNVRLVPTPALKVDGDFGPATRDALIRFQRSRGIAPTGAADAPTWKSLNPPDHGPEAKRP